MPVQDRTTAMFLLHQQQSITTAAAHGAAVRASVSGAAALLSIFRTP